MESTTKALLFKRARLASRLLKSLANEHRMLILCKLVDAERSVSELGAMLGIRQPTLSQQLARLCADGLVATRRNGKTVYYSLSCSHARAILDLV